MAFRSEMELSQNPGDEEVTIVDGDNRIVGSTARRNMRALRLEHRATYILVFNSRGELCVQKRTETKDVFPGYWDPAAGGVVLANETYEECAERELGEELGVRGVALTPLFEFRYSDERTGVWGRAFSCVYDGPLVLQADEVERVEFLAPEEALRRSEEGRFTPDGVYVLRRYLGGEA